VRKVAVLKVWTDVVDDELGTAPFDAEQVLRPRGAREFRPEAIGYLTTPVDMPAWATAVSERFRFLRDLDDDEQRFARCSRADERDVRSAIAALADDAVLRPEALSTTVAS
jgi:hypothetical protein